MTRIAFCGPGRRPYAELILALTGEHVDQVMESRYLPTPDAIYIAAADPELLIPPFTRPDLEPRHYDVLQGRRDWAAAIDAPVQPLAALGSLFTGGPA